MTNHDVAGIGMPPNIKADVDDSNMNANIYLNNNNGFQPKSDL